MPFVRIDVLDGGYSIKMLSDQEAKEIESDGGDVALIEEPVLDAWFRHCDQNTTWKAFWRAVDSACGEKRKRRGQYDVVFTMSGVEGECKRGPFDWAKALSERSALLKIDPSARIRNLETDEEV